MSDSDRYFPSEKDRWLGLLVWAPLLAVPYAAITGGDWEAVAIGLSIPALLVSWIWFGTGYRVTASELHVRSGPFRFRVPLSSIRRVRPTTNALSSPSLSLRRLEISLADGRFILISPKDRERFIALLRERCPQARIEA